MIHLHRASTCIYIVFQESIHRHRSMRIRRSSKIHSLVTQRYLHTCLLDILAPYCWTQQGMKKSWTWVSHEYIMMKGCKMFCDSLFSQNGSTRTRTPTPSHTNDSRIAGTSTIRLMVHVPAGSLEYELTWPNPSPIFLAGSNPNPPAKSPVAMRKVRTIGRKFTNENFKLSGFMILSKKRKGSAWRDQFHGAMKREIPNSPICFFLPRIIKSPKKTQTTRILFAAQVIETYRFRHLRITGFMLEFPPHWRCIKTFTSWIRYHFPFANDRGMEKM